MGCAFEHLMGVEVSSKNAMILHKKKYTQNNPTCRSNTPPKMGYFLELSPRGTYVMYDYLKSLQYRVPSQEYRYMRYLITARPRTQFICTLSPRSRVESAAYGFSPAWHAIAINN